MGSGLVDVSQTSIHNLLKGDKRVRSFNAVNYDPWPNNEVVPSVCLHFFVIDSYTSMCLFI